MADPTIQTFCCHHGNDTYMTVKIMDEFNTDTYNAVCLTSSALGMIGAIYQILPRQHSPVTHRWLSFSATRGRKIIIWLAVADLLASIAIFIRSLLWMHFKSMMPGVSDHSSVLSCAILSATAQYSYGATWIWTLCAAVDTRRLLLDRPQKLGVHHLVAWSLPAVLTGAGLLVLYYPDAKCHTNISLSTALLRILPNYLFTYIPIAVVMVANPWLYASSCRAMERILTSRLGQVTSREREVLNAVKVKFALTNAVFYICWLPNLFNGLLLWSMWKMLPVQLVVATWYVMAFVNPLQALLNSLVYRRWTAGTEKIYLPWIYICGIKPRTSLNSSFMASTNSQTSSLLREENLPLLRSIPRASINRYA